MDKPLILWRGFALTIKPIARSIFLTALSLGLLTVSAFAATPVTLIARPKVASNRKPSWMSVNVTPILSITRKFCCPTGSPGELR